MTAAEALRFVCDAWEAGDPDAAAGLFAPDGVYEDPLYPEALTGPEAIRAGMVEGMGAIEDCRVTLDPVIEDGDRVLAIGFFARSSGTEAPGSTSRSPSWSSSGTAESRVCRSTSTRARSCPDRGAKSPPRSAVTKGVARPVFPVTGVSP